MGLGNDDDRHCNGNSYRFPETTTKETEEYNRTGGFSGPNYVLTTENKKITVETSNLLGAAGKSQFTIPSNVRVPERSSETYQRQRAPDSLFARRSNTSVSGNGLDPVISRFSTDCEHRTLFGNDFGGSNNVKTKSLFGGHSKDNKHVIAGSFSTTEPKDQSGATCADAYAGYMHTPTGSKADVHANFTNSGTQVHGRGMYNVDKDNAFSGSVAINKRGKSWNSHGELAYQHKPTRSEVAMGVCNSNGETDLTLRGQTKILRDRGNHSMDGSVLVKQRIGGPLGVNANLDYKHKPSNTHMNVGVKHDSNATTVNTGINTRIKNRASLGASGYYAETPETRKVGFQVSGGF